MQMTFVRYPTAATEEPVGSPPADDHQPALAARPQGAAVARRGPAARRPRRCRSRLRPADPRRGAPRRPRRAAPGLRRRLAADQARPPARAALHPPAVPVGDAAQRLPGVVHRAAGDPRRPALRPRGGPGPRGRQADGRPPAQARHRERRRHAPVRRAAHVDDRRRVPRERARGPPAARRVHRPATSPHRPPDRPQGRRPGHAAAQEAAVLQPGRLRAHRRGLPGDPGTAVRAARTPTAG